MEKLGTSEEEIVLKLCKGGLLLATHAEVEGTNTNKPRILTEPDKPSLKERRTPVGFFYLARGPDPAPSTQCNSGQRGPSLVSRKGKGGQSHNLFIPISSFEIGVDQNRIDLLMRNRARELYPSSWASRT